ncbi:MAG: tyrosine recombinase [Dehalococcoidia bacterium]|nr:tyrosine recombinase [Dehalococcoidia bacterium]
MSTSAQANTCHDLIDRYVTDKGIEKNLSDLTVRNYRNDLRDFARFLEKEAAGIEQVDRVVVRGYLAELANRGMARASVIRKVSTIKGFYSYLYREGHIEQDRLISLRSPKRQQRLPSFLAVAQIEGLLNAPERDTPQGLRDRAILELLFSSGVRVSELIDIDLSDVGGGQTEVIVRGKGDKERRVFIGRPARAALDIYLRQGRPQLLKGQKRAGALFLNRYGDRLSARSIQKSVRSYAVKAGIEQRAYPHLLRHSFATHMLDGGAELRVVQELLGHANVNTTQIYTHVTHQRQKEVYDQAFYAANSPRRRP